ncbi:MAG TPA: caspase family protein [Saprospiraceae bacterium]|nr:caspase family protein [Saprospiraceae bacterium]HMX84621.1 caspase family protein [Saprospiraceae bacterium]HMZ73465.1 caspase family protein [Saprospiraceae bacterium]HNE65680.1 caspase family protein [Saprospiraceae bacterium]HNL29269.1 caspase family protein [Saprospiraceae bacterium]
MLGYRRLIWLIFILVALSFNTVKAERIGLIIAIGQYEKAGNGYTNLSSLRDVILLDSVLKLKKFDKIIILRDEQATKSGIVSAIRSITSSVKRGDVVFIHFSCHGILIADENGRYAEECLVTWDSPFHLKPGTQYKGERHLTYTELKQLRNTLRQKLGRNGDVLMLFDACHSGGLTRGRDRIRGVASSLKIQGWRTFSNQRFGSSPMEDSLDSGSPYVAISACKTEQSNHETSDGQHACGSLSLVFTKAVLALTDKELSYDRLYDRICDEMFRIHPAQFPVMTGTNTARKIFGGQFVPHDDYFRILSYNAKRNEYTMDGGKIHSLTSGSEFDLVNYENDRVVTQNLKMKIIKEPGVLTSIIQPVGELSENFNYRRCKLKLATLAYSGRKITISLDSLSRTNPALVATLTGYFIEDQEISVRPSESELYLQTGKNADIIEIRHANDGSLACNAALTPENIRQSLITYAQFTALRQLNLRNEAFKVAVGLLTIDGKEANNILYSGQTVQMCIENNNESKKSVFVNVFDFMPDGRYKLIIEDLQIDGDSKECFSSTVSEPFGHETIMVMSTPMALSLGSLSPDGRDAVLKSRGTELHILQEIFGWPTTGTIRGKNPKQEEGYTIRLNFNILPNHN